MKLSLIAASIAAAVLGVAVLPIAPALAGPTGVKGITTQTVVTQVTALAGQTGEADASCGAGELLVGGGYTVNSSVTDWSVYVDAPDGPTWLVEIVNNDAQPLSFSAYAICALSVPGKKGITGMTTHDVQTQVVTPANQTGEAEAPCGANELLTGGGYDVFNVSPNWSIYVNSPLNGNTWLVEIDNEVPLSTTFDSYAVCLGKTNGKPMTGLTTATVTASATAGANQVTSVAAKCGSKQLLTGGGSTIESIGQDWRTVQSAPITNGSWTAEIADLDSFSRPFDSFAVCLAKA
jgi:hypothetical protein